MFSHSVTELSRDLEVHPAGSFELHAELREDRRQRSVDGSQSQLRLSVSIEFELGISDEPGLSSGQARSYSFNGVRLDVVHRGMEQDTNVEFDEETESPRPVVHAYLRLRSLRAIEDLIAKLAHDDRSRL